MQGLESGAGLRSSAARVAPSPAFKRLLPASTSSTPLKTASLRTSMAAFSGRFYLVMEHGCESTHWLA